MLRPTRLALRDGLVVDGLTLAAGEQRIDLTAFPSQRELRALARLAGQWTRFGGTASLTLDAHGTARSPVGSLRLDVRGLRAGGIPPTDVRLSAEARDGAASVRASLVVARGERHLASATASLALASSRITDWRGLTDAPVRANVVLGPIDLQRLVAPALNDRDPPRLLGARVQAKAALEGTLRSPRLTVAAAADQVRLQGVPLGQAHLRLD